MIELERHEEMFIVWPALAVEMAACDNPDCGERHWRIQFGWLIWTIYIQL
jgi:hypothetical protein